MAGTESFKFPSVAQEAKRRLISRIGDEWQVGSRLPPIPELAKELGVGQANTHRAVRELVSEGVLISRQRLGTFVSDAMTPNQLRRLSDKRPSALASKQVCTLVGVNLTEGFVVDMHDAFSKAMAEEDCVIEQHTFSSGRSTKLGLDGHKGILEAIASHEKADAIAIFNPNTRPDIVFDPEQIMVLISTGMDNQVNMPGRFDVVSVDQEQGGLLAGRRLRDAGCRDVAFVGVAEKEGDTEYNDTTAARLRGFERGWGSRVAADRRLFATGYSEGRGARVVVDFLKLKPQPDGVFCADDSLAVGFVRGALAHELEPGRDYSIIGFDGQPIATELHEGPLTTVAVPTEEMGQRLAELLVERFADPDRPVRRLQLGCSLWEGKTVCPSSAKARG